MVRWVGRAGFAVSVLVGAGCGARSTVTSGPAAAQGAPLDSMATWSAFDRAMRSTREHDRRGDWRAADCAQVASQFRAAWRADPSLREALYNASVAELRCLGGTPPQQRQLSSVEMRARPYEGFVRLTPIASRLSPVELQRALEAANNAQVASPGDPTTLAHLAALHIERGYWGANIGESTRDFAAAEAYLDRALMIDEGAASARTHLALLHLARAQQQQQQGGRTGPGGTRCGGAEGTDLDARAVCIAASKAVELERALAVALQVVREHPMYAPARNAMGLVSYELRDITEAVRQFSLATELQPNDVDAYTNLGGALLSARSFGAAERAYEAALALREDAYEAHLGRAVALGAELDERRWDLEVARVESELAECKQIAPDRPEAYYNEAWLKLASEARSTGAVARVMAVEAGRSFDTFIAKAGVRRAYSQEVQSARAKLGELRLRERSTR
jgi:tetratricopeptide (TPR) repeat protein